MEEIKKFAKYFMPYRNSIVMGILFILISMAIRTFDSLSGRASD